MKRFLTSVAIAVGFCVSLAARDSDPSSRIAPRPQSIELARKMPIGSSFKVAGCTINYDSSLDERSKAAIESLAARLTTTTGKSVSCASPVGIVKSAQSGAVKGMVFFKDNSLGSEQYTITVNDKSVLVAAGGFNGILYAIQTIKQLLPAAIYGKRAVENENWRLPCMTIKDSPRFSYRGILLDCSRHFFSTDEIKRCLDVMAMFKLNRFHWHLTDDQGWRVEILKYPRLTQVGAFRDGTQIAHRRGTNDGIRYGGYYTQDQIREIVAYAGNLGIEVIPEIDLPGHMLSALASYPELGCSGGPYEVWTQWGVSRQVLCGGNDRTMQFLRDVLDEISDLFPYRYIHIGGDECPKDEWIACPQCQARIAALGLKDDESSTKEQKLQGWITSQAREFLSGKGKSIIGWDEICEGGLTGEETVMSWRGMEGAVKAIKAGADVILTPRSHFYFNFYQSEDRDLEPLAYKDCIPLEKVYGFDPFDTLKPEDEAHILGIQGNLWSEYIDSDRNVEYMLLPRLLALCELQWGNKPDFEQFSSNLISHEFQVLSEAGYTYCKVITGVHGYDD